MGDKYTRRGLLAAAPAFALMPASAAVPAQAQVPDLNAVLAVITELESWQGWESSGTVCAKAFAAYRMRQALGLDLPDPTHARDHLYFQNEAWNSYARTVRFERDQLEGKNYSSPLPMSALGKPIDFI
ncbi:MAG: hypothetical protein Q8K33_19975 [Cypionkella sp.]|uniref:hypothetical protein n=1 Tax=Cypionkella sp. TaxID=2811411 RepID=UPI0027311E19|nr:hypothetical protein [Cypionkella sp.]MDP2051116.1 hypothetical protein [Cypionkella sp.]